MGSTESGFPESVQSAEADNNESLELGIKVEQEQEAIEVDVIKESGILSLLEDNMEMNRTTTPQIENMSEDDGAQLELQQSIENNDFMFMKSEAEPVLILQTITMPILSSAKEELCLLKGNDKFNVHNNPVDDKTTAIISAQLERKETLRNAVVLKKSEIAILKREVEALREKLLPFPSVQLDKLKEENHQLRIECDLMAREVDKRTNGNAPLGETSENFYLGINPGQGVNALIRNITKNQPNLNPASASSSPSSNSKVTGRFPIGSRNVKPPPRPPPPKYLPIPNQYDTSSPNGEWNCTVCTFKNHPDMNECEQCAMVRFQPSPSPSSPSRGHY